MTYTVLRELGRGGFGAVFEVVDENGHHFAMKRFQPDASIKVPHGQLLKRFRREAVYQRKIDSPHVIKIVDQGEDEYGAYIIMELAQRSLKDFLEKNKHLGHDERVAIIRDVTSGLRAVHGASCTHRDLKPENILGIVDSESINGYRFAISDFGLVAPPSHAETTLTMTGMAGGSTYYASPEAMKSMNRCDARSDIYSIGCIVYDLFVCKPRIPLDHLKAAGEIGRVVSRSTETNPSKRYQSISEFSDDFIFAVDIEKWSPNSPIEARYLEILTSESPTEDEWDEIDINLQGILQEGTVKDAAHPIFRAMRAEHFDQIKDLNYGVFRSISNGLVEHVLANESAFNFDYCDVIALKLRRVAQIGSPEESAAALLALLVLGVSHNRFYVERVFGAECSASLADEVAERFLVEAEARGYNVRDILLRWRDSLGENIPTLHPRVVEAWT